MSDDLLERLGALVDKADNMIAASGLPGVPPETHVEGMRIGLREIREEARRIVVENGGDDWWTA